MFALVKTTEKEGYDLKRLDIPNPERGELLIKVDRVSICGSDINLYKWNDGTFFYRFRIFFIL